jgi:hypothetical protein
MKKISLLLLFFVSYGNSFLRISEYVKKKYVRIFSEINNIHEIKTVRDRKLKELELSRIEFINSTKATEEYWELFFNQEKDNKRMM